jgi:hypothetical protein
MTNEYQDENSRRDVSAVFMFLRFSSFFSEILHQNYYTMSFTPGGRQLCYNRLVPRSKDPV